MSRSNWRWGIASIALGLLASLPLEAAALRVLVIGDSLTEEYAFELPFSAPDSEPWEANTKNWVEILSARRADSVTLGSYQPSLLSYPDLRNGGYRYNFGVPGFETSDWINVCNSNIFDSEYSTRYALDDRLNDVDAVVIFLGGNDLKSDYSGIFNDPAPPPLLAQVVSNLASIHDYVRDREPTLPIIISTVPDIGATAEVAGKYTDPARRAVARQRIADMNASIIAMAAGRGATVARIDEVTDRIFDQVPLHLNGTEFIFAPHPENPPLRLFCKDGFHPATSVQSLIANLLVDALNRATPANIPPLPNREILGPVLGLNPDHPYLIWAAGAGGMFENPDGDGLPNLAEFVLESPPLVAGSPFVFETNGLLRFTPSTDALRFAEMTVEESVSLREWVAVPPARINISADGTWRILPAGVPRAFYRLAVVPRP